MDFRKFRKIGEKINHPFEQLEFAKGYDHNFVLEKKESLNPQSVAKAFSEESGILLEVLTTEPGLHFYSGNYIEREAFCLETQHFPDSPNQPSFPCVILEPHDSFESKTIYRFGIK